MEPYTVSPIPSLPDLDGLFGTSPPRGERDHRAETDGTRQLHPSADGEFSPQPFQPSLSPICI
ncbi:unnamed protein product, partial [Cylicostephanus goldi]